MATTGIKYDDGTGGFAANCFPVRGLLKQLEEAGGAWMTAQRAEQRRRFKAVLCSKPRTFEQIRDERRRSEKEGTTIVPPPFEFDEEEDEDSTVLDGFYLMKHCCVEDPADLCSINIAGKGLSEVKQDDFALFDNVAYVNAAENYLPFSCFKAFPIIRELEIPLNALRNLKIYPGDFETLEVLDLSYNNLSSEDVLPLGLIPNLRILHLTGNNLKTLPADLARPKIIDSSIKFPRFQSLEILMVDDNKLSDLATFASLAGLRNLKHLNLSKNEIFSVPQLMLVEGRHVTQDIHLSRKPRKRSGRRSRNRGSPPTGRSGNVETPPPERQGAEFDGGDKSEMVVTGREDPQAPPPTDREPGDKAATEKDQELPTLVEEKEVTETEEETFGELGELNLEELDAKVEDTLSQAREAESRDAMTHDVPRDDTDEEDQPLPPPFPELRYLNLSHNQLTEEESLLAVAAWPMLSELIIHDNPLTTTRSGDPPLLKRFLADRLGIQLQRKPTGALEKPHIEIPQKADRTIKTKVPPIPRCNVEQLLALEAPKTPAMEAPSRGSPTRSVPSRGPTPSNPLPPIPPTPSEGEEGEGDYGGDAFFMTQVDDPAPQKSLSPHPPPLQRPAGRRQKRRALPKQYKGYEELIDTEDNSVPDEDVPMPKDIQGNIRALQYALNHPLVFRENKVDLENRQKPFVPHEKDAGLPPSSLPTRKEKVAQALEAVKNAEPVLETPLNNVLKGKKKHSKEKDEAVKLLAQVQRRYNKVRVSSMKQAHSSAGSSRQIDEAQNILLDTISTAKQNVTTKS